jgi:flagellar biosynthetic protein FliR
MSADAFPLTALWGFLLVLTRVSFALIFVPIPGMRNAPEVPKIVAAVAITLALYPLWPTTRSGAPPLSQYVRWILSEAAFGLTVGLIVSFLAEAFVLAAQIIGLQAGYSYASTIDPTTQNEGTVLQAMVQLFAGVLFFVANLHLEVIRIFAQSLTVWPAGSFMITEQLASSVWGLGSAMFSTGLRLAFPVIALMVLIDLAIALIGRVNAQMQLLTVAFPIKMLAGIAMLASLLAVFPLVFARASSEMIAALVRLVR